MYQVEDVVLIDLQILLNNVQRNVWHPERRITSQIFGVKRLLAVSVHGNYFKTSWKILDPDVYFIANVRS